MNAKTIHGNPLAQDRVRELSRTWLGAGNTNTNIKDNAICQHKPKPGRTWHRQWAGNTNTDTNI